jgi:hypothetical protein
MPARVYSEQIVFVGKLTHVSLRLVAVLQVSTDWSNKMSIGEQRSPIVFEPRGG